MVRNYVRKTVPYNKEDMEKAVSAVKNGDMGYKKAAKLYNLKWQTVRDHVKNPSISMGAGRPTVLTSAEEEELKVCLKLLAQWGFGMTRKETQEVIGDYIKSIGRSSSFADGMPGEDWMSGYLQRHPDLTCRQPEQMKASRQKSSANRLIYNAWFQLLKKTLVENGLLNKPERIYNVDESGFPLDPRRLRVISEKGIKSLFRLIGGSGRETITVQGCCRADGVMLPPYILYAAKNLRLKWTEGGPDGARYNVSDKGWMETTCFNDWFSQHFVPFLPPERPVVLIFDGHASHLSYSTVKLALKERVLILKLPSNSTHTLQPLDVGVYGPAKTAWERILVRFSRQNLGAALTKELFPSLVKALWDSGCMSSSNVMAGFRRCGIMPCDPSAIPESVYASAEIYDRPNPSHEDPGQPSVSTPTSIDDSLLHDNHDQPSTSASISVPLPSVSPSPSTSTFSSGPSIPPSPSNSDIVLSARTSTSNSNSSTPSRPSSSSSPQPTIKDFFMKRLTPMMKKPPTANSQRAIKRQYGESLTSQECLERLEKEEQEKTAKKQKSLNSKGKGKGKKTPAPTTTTMQTQPTQETERVLTDNNIDNDPHSDIDFDDSDSDPDWMPNRADKTATMMAFRRRNIFEQFDD